MRKALTAALAASLALAPVTSVAAQADASPLSLAGAVRAGPELQQPNEMGGSTILFVAVGVAAIILFFVLIDDDDDSDSP